MDFSECKTVLVLLRIDVLLGIPPSYWVSDKLPMELVFPTPTHANKM